MSSKIVNFESVNHNALSSSILEYKEYILQILTWVITPQLWRLTPLKKVYEKQSTEAKIDLNARVTAATHAAIVFCMSAYAILFVDEFDWSDVYT